MNPNKILITGSTGFVGLRLHRDLKNRFQVVGTHRGFCPGTARVQWIPFDADNDSPASLIEGVQPDCVIHLLALSRTEICAQQPGAAEKINRDLTLELARSSRDHGIRFVFTSTDQVFDGKKGDYSEEDTPRANGVYARTKIEAENGLIDLFKDQPDLLTVFRLALSYGHSDDRHPGPVGWIVNALEKGEPANLFVDEIRSPLYVGDISRAAIDTLSKGYSGLFHLGGRDTIDRHTFGVRIAEKLGLPIELCQPRSVADYSGPEPRSPNCSFNIAKFVQTFGWTPMGVEEGLERILEDNR